MKRIKYLLTFFIGTLIYVFLSIFFGQNSIRCFNHLKEQKVVIENQVDELESINQELAMELNALKYDKAVIAAYARKLDYVSDGEKLVKITGMPKSPSRLYDAGIIIRHEETTYLSEISCKIIAVLFSLMTLVTIFLYDLNKGNIVFAGKKKKKPVVAGVPVYDLQQA